MPRHRALLLQRVLLVVSLAIGPAVIGLSGCDAVDEPLAAVTQTRSDLVTGQERIAVPGYFGDGDTYSWPTFISNSNQDTLLFVNGPANGPPPTFDSTLASNIASLHSTRTAFGYVQFYYGRPWAAIKADIDNWVSNYQTEGLGGIFFDEAIRCPGPPSTACPNPGDDLAKVEYVEQYVNASVPNPVLNERMVSIFNWGTVSYEMFDYVYCTAYWGDVRHTLGAMYVTAEMTHDVYLAPSTDQLFANNNWLNGFTPLRFINIAYKNPDPNTWNTWDIPTMFGKAPGRNAGYMYLQDNTSTNTWGILASSSTWSTEYADIFNGQTTSWPGTPAASEPNPVGCPTPSPTCNGTCGT